MACQESFLFFFFLLFVRQCTHANCGWFRCLVRWFVGWFVGWWFLPLFMLQTIQHWHAMWPADCVWKPGTVICIDIYLWLAVYILQLHTVVALVVVAIDKKRFFIKLQVWRIKRVYEHVYRLKRTDIKPLTSFSRNLQGRKFIRIPYSHMSLNAQGRWVDKTLFWLTLWTNQLTWLKNGRVLFIVWPKCDFDWYLTFMRHVR